MPGALVAVKDQAIARLHGRGQVERGFAAADDRSNLAHEDTSLLGIIASDEHLVIVAVQEPVTESSGEGKLHLLDFPRLEFDAAFRPSAASIARR